MPVSSLPTPSGTTRLKVLIVDDEPVARTILREELEQFVGIDLVGEAESGVEALKMIETERPNVVFLDLQMPAMSGFEVVKRVSRSSRIPVFIVVTAYDEHAVRAFEAGAVDYLLKPVRHERLTLAIEKAARVLGQPDGPSQRFATLQDIADSTSPKPVRRIVARSGAEYLLLTTEEVFAFEAQGDLVFIITARKRLQATESLRKIQQKLENTSFKRIHRKVLVNIDHIRKMSPLTSQRWLVTMSNNMEFIVSKRQAKSVRDLLSW